MAVATEAREAMVERVLELMDEGRFGSLAVFGRDGSGGTLYTTDCPPQIPGDVIRVTIPHREPGETARECAEWAVDQAIDGDGFDD